MAAQHRGPDSHSPVYWLAAGLVAGAVAGFVFADRSRFGRLLGGPLERAVRLLGALQFGGGADDEALSDEEEFDDEDSEFAYESDDEDEDEDDEDEDNDHLDRRVLTAFEQDPVLSVRAIEIEEADEGVIRLTGRVPAERDIAHAVTIARGVPGVERVEHKLRLRQPRSEASVD